MMLTSLITVSDLDNLLPCRGYTAFSGSCLDGMEGVFL